MEYISAIEHALGQNAQKTMLGMQPGDVVETYADPSLLLELTGNVPSTPVTEGVVRFISWYREYYG
ncbi:UDP-glucuronic acid epimerase [Mycolicibacterium vaccae 95051]|nr:UDP-glucuronic acid epimerase [Mycolicibacterium vaccae 95051]